MKLNHFGVRFPVTHPKGACRVCGCTDEHACPGGCCWVLPEICSRCVERAEALLSPPKRRLADFWRAIEAETDPNVLTLALHNATGDWRRAAIHERLGEVQR